MATIGWVLLAITVLASAGLALYWLDRRIRRKYGLVSEEQVTAALDAYQRNNVNQSFELDTQGGSL